MKRVTLKLTAIVMLLGGAITVSNAQTTSDKFKVVTSAVPFLRISPNIRSAGMGDAGIATSPDVNSGFLNLAKLPFSTTKSGVGLTYTPWLRDLSVSDVYIASLAGYYKLDDMQALSGSLRYFSLGNIEFTDQSGSYLQTYKPREIAIDAGYSRKLSAKNSIGIAIRFINSNLAGTVGNTTYKKASTAAGDLHFFHNGVKENGEGFNWGAALSNLGGKISYTSDANSKDFIPANLGIGAAYTKVIDEDNKITFALDLNKLLVPTPTSDTSAGALQKYHSQGVVSSWFKSFGDADGGLSEEMKEINASIGAEYWYNNQFAFRAGYFYENPTKGNRKFLTVGAGLKYNVFGIDFSYIFPSGNGTNRNPLSNTYRFGLVFDFDGTAKK
ncbi:type IX secretion system outer membrane channel protein PorV [Ferruginibacter sp.]